MKTFSYIFRVDDNKRHKNTGDKKMEQREEETQRRPDLR